MRELNTSIYVFAADALWPALAELDDDNAQGELYLTDAVGQLVADGERGSRVPCADPIVGLGINNRAELAQAAAVLRDRLLEEHMLAGVTIVDPTTTWIEAEVELEPDAVIHPFTVLRGRTIVRRRRRGRPARRRRRRRDRPARDRRALRLPSAGNRARRGGQGRRLRRGEELDASGHGPRCPTCPTSATPTIGEDTNIAAGAITANYRPELERRASSAR